ncbi:hypothetical protein [Pseudomonas avellanae]|uniref:Uncharacterized protein n=1 Tax=Pseudomonas avellanae TaxID=46257 RepID=A0A3M5T518_9PSED|nr:hypothetical protein [Pseudomonas avellanae]RMU28671.1 hypothetical protein ALP32_103089 [Pseudomonas avellanae]UQW67888.1 hypothetical protein L2Y00_21905 [Pseudomonas avellanae]UQW74096.1 hypothetical protein L2Y01_26155 [Pseudomonas avellanae]
MTLLFPLNAIADFQMSIGSAAPWTIERSLSDRNNVAVPESLRARATAQRKSAPKGALIDAADEA